MPGGVREILGVAEVRNLTSVLAPMQSERLAANLADVGDVTLVRIACTEKIVGLTPDQARHFARQLVWLAKAAEDGE